MFDETTNDYTRERRLSQASCDETAIRDIIQEEIAAWNSGDTAAYSRHFAPDGTCTNIRGQFFTGHQAFLERHEYLFKGPFQGSTALHIEAANTSLCNRSNRAEHFSRHRTLATMLVYRDEHDKAATQRTLADVVASTLAT